MGGPAAPVGQWAAKWPTARALGTWRPQVPKGRGSEGASCARRAGLSVCPEDGAALGCVELWHGAFADPPVSSLPLHPLPPKTSLRLLKCKLPTPVWRHPLGLQNPAFQILFINIWYHVLPCHIPGTRSPAEIRRGQLSPQGQGKPEGTPFCTRMQEKTNHEGEWEEYVISGVKATVQP